MRRRATHWTIALQHAVAASIAIGIAVVVGAWLLERSTQTEFRLAVSELRARAGELQLLANLSDARALPPSAIRATAAQLRDRIGDAADDVEALARKSPVADAARVVQIARGLATTATRLASEHAELQASDTPARDIAANTQTLIAIETALHPR